MSHARRAAAGSREWHASRSTPLGSISNLSAPRRRPPRARRIRGHRRATARPRTYRWLTGRREAAAARGVFAKERQQDERRRRVGLHWARLPRVRLLTSRE